MPKNNSSFKKVPLSDAEKKAKEDSFLNFSNETGEQSKAPPIKNKQAPKKKEPVKTIYLRAPESYWEDLQTIVNTTGISMNAVCLELLRPAIKKKLRELNEEY